MKFEVKVEGIEQAIKNLHALPALIGAKVAKSAVHAGAKVLHAELITRAPVDEGGLRDSIKVTTRGLSKEIGYYVAVGRFYSRFLEFGWSKKPGGQPFFRPAVDASMQRIMDTVLQYFRKNTDRELKKHLKVTKPR